MKNSNHYWRFPSKSSKLCLEARTIFFSLSFYHKHSAVTDLWNNTEVILNITKGYPNALLLYFLWFCLPYLRWVRRTGKNCMCTSNYFERTHILSSSTRPLWQFSSLYLWNAFCHKQICNVWKYSPNLISYGHQHKKLNVSFQNGILLIQTSLIIVSVIPFPPKKT